MVWIHKKRQPDTLWSTKNYEKLTLMDRKENKKKLRKT